MALYNYLKQFSVKEGGGLPITHTSYAGGKYHIPDASEEEFLNAVYKNVVMGKKEEHLIERQRDNGVIIIDLDFRYELDCNKRMHNKDWVEDVLHLYTKNLKEIMHVTDKPFKIFVMEKDYITKDISKGYTKDGIHIIIGINCPHSQQMKLRDLVMNDEDCNTLLSRVPLVNSVNDVFDEALSSGKNGIVLFGCNKLEQKPYNLTYAYEVTYDPVDGMPSMVDCPITVTKETFLELSIRNNANRTQFEFKQSAVTSAPKQNKQNTISPVVAVDINDKWHELLFNVIRNDVIKIPNKKDEWAVDWNRYHRIAKILKTNNYPIDVLIKWCQLAGDLYKESHKLETQKLWDGIDISNHNHLRGLQTIAKEMNTKYNYDNGYKNWLTKHNENITLKTLEDGENDVGKFIAPQLQEDLVFCNNRWYMFDANIGLWRVVCKPHSLIITHIQDRISESRAILNIKQENTTDDNEKKKLESDIAKFTKHYKDVGKGSFSAQIINVLTQLLYDGLFDKKLDTTTYQVAYLNGIFDLRTLTFRPRLFASDYLTKTIPYNYQVAADEDVAFVRNELLKICNYTESHLEYYLSFLGCAMTGDSMKIQEFWYLRGQTASNGKSVIFDALTQIIPNYVTKLESDLFEVDYGSRHKEVATWRGVRIAWLNEVSTKKQDDKEIKNLAEGTPLRYKVMFGEMSTMPITFKLFFVSNNTMNFKADNGVKRRLRMVQLDSEFVDGIQDDFINHRFKKDTSFGTLLLTKYKFALMYLIYSYSQKFAIDGKLKPYPAEWNEMVEEVCADNNDLQGRILDIFDFTPNATATKNEIENQLKQLNINSKAFKDTVASMHKKVKYYSQEKYKDDNGKWQAGMWHGIQLKVESEVTTEKDAEETDREEDDL